MVKVGFIVEGDTEERILKHASFVAMLEKMELSFIKEIVNAEGRDNLISQKLGRFVNTLVDKGATKVVILADLEDEKTIETVKKRIDPDGIYIVIIAVQAIEAWLLSDSEAISQYLKSKYFCEFPEEIPNPFDFIRSERLRLTGRGIGAKVLLIKDMFKVGFSLEAAASHPHCPSARYFLQKLTSLANTTD